MRTSVARKKGDLDYHFLPISCDLDSAPGSLQEKDPKNITPAVAVAEIAVSQHGLQRVWTGTVLMWGTERGLLAEQVHSKVIVDLLRLGYVYTQLTPSVFQWAGESDLWSPAGRNLAACLDWLANPYTMSPEVSFPLSFAASVVRPTGGNSTRSNP